MRLTEPAHRHPPSGSCLATCPWWRWEWDRSGKQLKLDLYYTRKDIDELLEQAFLDVKDFMSLKRLRDFQREHPNRWPRL